MVKLSMTLMFVFLELFVEFKYSTSTYSNNPCGQLYLTQSPNHILELNWNFTCQNTPDTLLLTLDDPLGKNTNVHILYKLSVGSVVKGYHKTNVSVKDVSFPGNWSKNADKPDPNVKCFRYYIASVKNNTIIYSQCLSIAPVWMSSFGDLRIGALMIPGTHNSGAWRVNLPLIRKFILNQNKNFWQQLVFGIRYFDIRIGRYGKAPHGFFINHDIVRCTALLPELQSVSDFIKKSPREIIILNFHRFPYPSKFLHEYHLELVDLLKTQFKNMIIPYPQMINKQGPKLKELWQTGRNVIISYSDYTLLKEKNWLWPPVNRKWGNIQQIKELEYYIKQQTSEPAKGNPMTVLMAELTPKNYLDVLKDATKNLQDLLDVPKNLEYLASMVNKDLSHWIRHENCSDNLNIIATDFFTGNDVINVAIETNFRKLSDTLL